MISGKYVVSSNDTIISEFKNVITASGFIAINSFLTGNLRSWAGTLAIGGLANTVAASTDVSLNYELTRYPVAFRSYYSNSGSNQIVLKATLSPFDQFQCFEIGVFAPKVNLNSFTDHKKISDFSEGTWVYQNGNSASNSFVSPNARSNSKILGLTTASLSTYPGASTIVLNNMNFDTHNYNGNDTVNLLYTTSSAINNNASVLVYFADSSGTLYGQTTQYWSASAALPITSSTNFNSASMTLNTSNAASWTSPISSMSVVLQTSGSTATIGLDHIKFQHNLYPTLNNVIVSRSSVSSNSLSTPIFTKYYGQPMDIEYYIDVT